MPSGFSILDYLDHLHVDKEYSTWIKAVCPVCQGNLKINKNNGSYACYSNECHLGFPNKIRNKLYVKTAFNQSNAFNLVNKPSTLVDIVKPLKNFSNVDPNSFLTSIEFERPKSIFNKKEGKLFTYFDYIDFEVVRIDYLDIIRDKDQYYQYTDTNGNLILDLPKTLSSIPLYRKEYLSESILIAEGEKAATMGQKLGFNILSLPTFLYSQQHLNKVFSYLKQHVKYILVLNDNDAVGIKKAHTLCKYAWKYGITSDALNLVDYYTEFEHIHGFDIYDLVKEKNISKEEFLWLISSHITKSQT